MFNKIEQINNGIEKILTLLGSLCFFALILVVILQIVTRLFLPWPVSWTEEISRFLFLYSIAFMAPVALKKRDLVFVDMFVTTLSTRMQLIFLAISDFLITLLSAMMLLKSWEYAELGLTQIAPATMLPMFIPYATMFILSFFLTWFGIMNCLQHFEMQKKP